MSIPFLTKYESIYSEAMRGAAWQKFASATFSRSGVQKLSTADQALVDEIIEKIDDLRSDLIKILKEIRTKFKTLDSQSTKLRLKNSQKFKPFTQTPFADGLGGDMHSNIADVEFPGEFGEKIKEFQAKYREIYILYHERVYNLRQELRSKLNSNIATFETVMTQLHLTQSSTYRSSEPFDAIRLGITPVNDGGFYRLHAVNAPLDFFKGATNGIGIGKYLYLAVIHHCGEGFTDGGSPSATKMWGSLLTRSDIYTFMAPVESGNPRLILGISTRVPKETVITILDKFIKVKCYSWQKLQQISSSFRIDKTFLNWCAYRRMFYGDKPENILDTDLYTLLKDEVDAYVTESNLTTLFPGVTVSSEAPPERAVSQFERLYETIISYLADNTSTMATIVERCGSAHQQIMALGENERTGYIFKDVRPMDVNITFRSYYFYLRKTNSSPSVEQIKATLNSIYASSGGIIGKHLQIEYGNVVKICNLGYVSLTIKELNNILRLLYSKYNKNVELWLSLDYKTIHDALAENKKLTLTSGKYLLLPDERIMTYTKDQLLNSVGNSFPNTLPSTVPTASQTSSYVGVPYVDEEILLGPLTVKIPDDVLHSFSETETILEFYRRRYGATWRLPTVQDLEFLGRNMLARNFQRTSPCWTNTGHLVIPMDITRRPTNNQALIVFVKGDLPVRNQPTSPTSTQTRSTRGQRRQGGSAERVREWINSVGKTRDSILRFLRDFPLSELIRRYNRWLRNTHPGEASMSYVGFRNFILRDYPEVRDVLGR